MINRSTLLTTALTLGAMKAFPGLSHAQARPLVFATFTGSWEEAHKAVLVPAFRKANADARSCSIRCCRSTRSPRSTRRAPIRPST